MIIKNFFKKTLKIITLLKTKKNLHEFTYFFIKPFPMSKKQK